MQRSKSYALLFLIGALIAGIAIGITVDRYFTHDRHDRHGPGSGLDRMSKELDLTAAQRTQVDSIMTRRRTQMRELYKPLRPQLDSLQKIGKVLSDSTHEQLKRVLTPEQGKKLDEMRERGRKEAAEMRARRDSGKVRPSPTP
ncbi:MAG TPA: Spy/CpxP family protein refolding chaperone [Gemmatimonadaceae bacterium]|nr:Spy/CpxP family protein refolding chaperone [Gemmatimonadaceae bacterium]